ncbi:MAG: hypothetical protein JNL67_06545 [Planctomycetaceae bacterium]|nr:hypothetical protein [Planctomycetaceae bacterium]
MANYLFVTCQSGMEPLVKSDYLLQVPEARLAFSRRGLVTFKLPDSAAGIAGFEPRSILARTFGTSLAHVKVPTEAHEAEQLGEQNDQRWGAKEFGESMRDEERFSDSTVTKHLIEATVSQVIGNRLGPWDGAHLWVRDGLLPATNSSRQPGREPAIGWEKFVSRLTAALQAAALVPPGVRCNQNADFGQRILDLCLLEPSQIFIGQHEVRRSHQRWSGGVIPLVPTTVPPISRAYFKIREAVSWAGLHLRPGQTCVEIGSAPGGSCQWLLEQDLRVIGIDPADIDPVIATHPNFTHIRRRGREVRRQEIKNCDWLLSDANLPPNYVLDTIADLVSHPSIKPKGLVLTLKLPDTKLLEHWQVWQSRVADWGFPNIRGRQLIFNRQEVCLVATRS